MKPVRTALILSATFLAVSVAYIVFSDWLALQWTSGADELAAVQSVKGTVYVATVAVGLFGITWAMFRRIDLQMQQIQTDREALLQSERTTLVGTLAASIGHDANNLIGAVRANLDFVLEDDGLDAQTREALQDCRFAADDLIGLCRRLRDAARHRTGERLVQTSVSRLVEESLAMIETHSRVRQCEVEVDVEPVSSSVIPGLVRHAVINLTLNAAEAAGSGGTVRVSLRSTESSIELVVEDDGPGFAQDARDSAFEPFVTSKEAGTGLGLFSVAYCADEHGGAVEIGDSELGGAKMTLTLACNATSRPSDAAATSRPALTGSVG